MSDSIQHLEEQTRLLGKLAYAPRVSLSFTLSKLLQITLSHKASYLHLTPGQTPIVRIGQSLVPVGDHILTPDDCLALLSPLLNNHQLSELHSGQEVDLFHTEHETCFRIQAFLGKSFTTASIRPLRTNIPSLQDLLLHGSPIQDFLDSKEPGLLILCGAPNSGKITTLAALIEHINKSKKNRIITIENLIQFWHKSEKSTVIQRELGVDTQNCSLAVRKAAQHDPDLLTVTNMPDKETFEAVVQAAAGGFKVIALFDGPNCVEVLRDFIQAFASNKEWLLYLLSKSLRLMACQHLLKRKDTKGLIPAFEILQNFPSVEQAISNFDLASIPSIMRAEGMETLGQNLSHLIRYNMITKDQALKLVPESELDSNVSQEAQRLSIPTQESPPETSEVEFDDHLMNWL